MHWKYKPQSWCSSTCLHFRRFSWKRSETTIYGAKKQIVFHCFLNHAMSYVWVKHIPLTSCHFKTVRQWKKGFFSHSNMVNIVNNTYERMSLAYTVLTLPENLIDIRNESLCEFCVSESKEPEKCCSRPAEGHLLNSEWISNPV